MYRQESVLLVEFSSGGNSGGCTHTYWSPFHQLVASVGIGVSTDRRQNPWKIGCALDPVGNFELRVEWSKEWETFRTFKDDPIARGTSGTATTAGGGTSC